MAIEIKKAQEKEAKKTYPLVKQQEKDNVRKLREKLSRQKEQDKMLASTVKIMKSMFTIKKPIQNTAADRVARKALKEKLKRDKEYDRVDKEVLKAMNNIFKVTKKRRIKQNYNYFNNLIPFLFSLQNKHPILVYYLKNLFKSELFNFMLYLKSSCFLI